MRGETPKSNPLKPILNAIGKQPNDVDAWDKLPEAVKQSTAWTEQKIQDAIRGDVDARKAWDMLIPHIGAPVLLGLLRNAALSLIEKVNWERVGTRADNAPKAVGPFPSAKALKQFPSRLRSVAE